MSYVRAAKLTATRAADRGQDGKLRSYYVEGDMGQSSDVRFRE